MPACTGTTVNSDRIGSTDSMSSNETVLIFNAFSPLVSILYLYRFLKCNEKHVTTIVENILLRTMPTLILMRRYAIAFTV